MLDWPHMINIAEFISEIHRYRFACPLCIWRVDFEMYEAAEAAALDHLADHKRDAGGLSAELPAPGGAEAG